jgi:hypothetical protein
MNAVDHKMFLRHSQSALAAFLILLSCHVAPGASEGLGPHPMIPDELRAGLRVSEAIEILLAENWRPEERNLSRITPVEDKQISLWFGDRKIAFTTCAEIRGDLAVANGRRGLANCLLNFRRGDRRLQLTTLHRFLGAGSGETPVITGAEIETYVPHFLNNPPGSPVKQALDYLEAEGWKADPHLYDGPTEEEPTSGLLKEWYEAKRISNIQCWDNTYSESDATQHPESIDAYGMSQLPAREVPACYLSFVKEGKRLVFKATSGQYPTREKPWAGPLILDWELAGDMPDELVKIQPGMRLSQVLRTLKRRFENSRQWVPTGSRQEFLERTPASKRALYRAYTKRGLYNAFCSDPSTCKLLFMDKQEPGNFTHLEIDFMNDVRSRKEPKVIRASVWYGGGT